MTYLMEKKLPKCLFFCLDRFLRLFHKSHEIKNMGKILLCNIAHLGDVVIATSVIPLLKNALPDSQIGFLTSSYASCVINKHPAVTWKHEVNHWKLSRDSLSLLQKIKAYSLSKKQALTEIRAVGYDIAIDLYPYFPNAIPLLAQSKIPVTIGYASGGFSPLLTHPISFEKKSQTMMAYHADLVKILPVHLNASHLHYDLPQPKKNIPPSWGLAEDFVLFHVGSGESSRNWDESSWCALTKLMGDQPIVFTGKGMQETGRIQRIIQNARKGLDLSSKLSWEELCLVVSLAKATVSADTAVMHIAEAFDVFSIGIFNDPQRSLLWKAPHTEVLLSPLAGEVFKTLSKSFK